LRPHLGGGVLDDVSDVIGRLVADQDVVRGVVRAATAQPRADVVGGSVRIDPVPVVSMATDALVRVQGTCTDGDTNASWSVVLKVVRSPDRSPIWAQIPPEFRDATLAEVPWRTEPELYRSALGDWLPDGLRLPAIYHVDEIDDGMIAIWMEDVATVDGPWTLTDYRRVAQLLGRLAGRFAGSELPVALSLGHADLRGYFIGRIRQGVLPALRDERLWAHPLVARVADAGLRRDLLALADAGVAILDQLETLPRALAHGDACPQNLLRGAGGDVVAIDWQFAGWFAVGFDVGQLIAGHAESADLDPAWLEAVHAGAVEEYTKGLHVEGMAATADEVALGAAGALIIRSAFTALPLELLSDEPGSDVARLFERRATFARFLVDLAHARFPFSQPRDA
jgi:Phosphotransferase enzyme family